MDLLYALDDRPRRSVNRINRELFVPQHDLCHSDTQES